MALIGGPLETSTAREREQGFRRALEDANSALPDELCVRREEFTHRAGRDMVLDLLDRNPPPTAVFCVNDVLAFGAIDGARSRGLRVPDDLWVVGFDDIGLASWESLSLTTVRQPIQDMADIGVQYLLERISGEAPAQFRHTRLPVELVIRGSTGGPR
jgi:LacI family transcriptional regulator